MIAILSAQAKFEGGGMDWPTATVIILVVLAGLAYAYFAERNK